MIIPTVLEKSATGERAYDIWSRLLKDRIIFLGQEVDDYIINLIIAQMLFLDREDGHRPIEFYINSPGGSVSAGLALFDVMNTISAPVNTTCVGLAASMGAVLLAGGTGTRSSLPHSRIMIHQVSSGARGTSADLRIQMAETNKLEDQLFQILADATGKTKKQIAKDCDRDYYMSAKEAMDYGLIDTVIESKKNGRNSQN
jgi:ATP-dependent Clp protease protease subunit